VADNRTVHAIAEFALALPQTISPYLYLMLAGFVVGILGHLFKLKILIGSGILMIALATLLLPMALVLSEDQPDRGPGIYAPGTK
jgi:hypothetical protein